MGSRVHLLLGANLGDRLATLRQAARDLEALGRVVARSSVWETEPLGPPPDYYNAAVALETDLDPPSLLAALLAIEERHGRVRSTRDAPRTLDLDVLLWEQRVIDSSSLQVPHPRLHEREFALAPLAEIAGDAVHPLLHRTIAGLLDDLPRARRMRRLAEPL